MTYFEDIGKYSIAIAGNNNACRGTERLQGVYLIKDYPSNYYFCDIIDLSNGLNRNIVLTDIDASIGDSVNSYIQFFNRIDQEKKIDVNKRTPIKIYIDSNGGSLTACFTIIDAITMSKTPVWTINIGKAYSAGFFIFITGHKRFAYPNSSFLFHEGSTGIYQDANKFKNYADFYKQQLEQLRAITLEHTQIEPEEYDKHVKDDWWFDVNEALKYGVTDKISYKLIY